MQRKNIFTLLVALATMSLNIGAQEIASVDSLLRSVREKDQTVRQKMQPLLFSGNPDSMRVAALQMAKVDQENQTVVFGLLDKSGWPEGLSDEANSAIFLVIDHADLAAKEKYYPLVKEKADAGVISKSDAATLQDRILMNKGKKQIYGTQTATVTENGKSVCYLWPVEEPERLDALRKEVGLPPLADYIALFKKQGLTLIWDRDLTIETLDKRIKGIQ